jgi:hypothetical protein
MARFAAGFRTGAGSTTLPIASLYSPANNQLVIYEIGVFNTTATALAVAVQRLTTTGTQGAGQTEIGIDDTIATALGTSFTTHTVAPTITAGFIRNATLGAAVGSGVIWTFSERGLRIPQGVANGVGITIPTGTGQVCDVYLEWSE